MSTKYLDKSGLSYFWTKIKSYVAGLLALKADDGNVVHKTGNEGISGTKTFSSQIAGTIGKSVGDGAYADMIQTYQSDNGANRSCTIRCTNGDGYNSIMIGAHDESNNAPNGLIVRSDDGIITGYFTGSLRLTRTTDASGTQDNSPALSIGSILGTHLELDGDEIVAKASGTTTGTLSLNADGGDVYIGGSTADYKSVTGRGKGSSTVPVYTDASGIVTACGSSLDVDVSGNAATATKLAAPVAINGVSFDGSANITVADSTKVAKAGDTMTGDLTISKAFPRLITKNTSITRGTAPSSDVAVTEILGRDSAEKSTWALYHTYTTNKAHHIHLLCYNGLTTDSQFAEIGVGYDSSGNPYTNAPTPSSTSDNTTKIATTKWVRTATGNFACNAATAAKLATARNLKTKLDSTTDVTFDGSGNQNAIPVTGVLPIANGGTGSSSKNFMDLSTDQTVSGIKTFEGHLRVTGTDTYVRLKRTDGSFADTSTNFGGYYNVIDKNGTEVMRLGGELSGSNSRVYLRTAYRENASIRIGVQLEHDGTTDAFIPLKYASGSWTAGSMLLGSPSFRWAQVYAVDSTISTSDARLKTAPEQMPDAVLDAWSDVGFVQFQMLDAVKEKGADKARLHSGLIAQQIEEAFRKRGLDASRYGLFCRDRLEASSGSGNGDVYSLRYVEALCMEAACMRRENARLKKRVADLEERLAALELKAS